MTKKISPGTEIKSGKELLSSEHAGRISTIFKLSRVSDSSFDLLYRPALENLAEHVQLFPGSEYHHHAHAGGLLVHILDVIIYSLKIRSGLQLPTGEPPEVIRTKADLYTYAVFVSALAHDMGKPVVDIDVMLYDHKGVELGRWDPYCGSMYATTAKSYTFRYRKKRKYQLHNLAASIFLTRVIPSEGLHWLASEGELFYDFLQFVNGNYDESYEITKIVSKGDQISVSLSLGADTVPLTGMKASKVPLPEKIKRAMKVVAADPATTFNAQGSAGWFDGEFCWVMSKRFVDDIRSQLESEGHTGIPHQNSRIFDVLVESGIIVPNNGKAIWKAHIEIDEWKPNAFSLLKVKKTYLWAESGEIDKFEGVIRVEGNKTGQKTVTGEQEQEERPSKDADNVISELIKANAIKQSEAGPKTQKVKVNDADKPSDLSSLFLASPGAEDKKSDADTEPVDDQSSDIPNFSGESDLGTDFLFWLKNGIKTKDIRYNGSEYFVHIIKEGVFIVSPKIFKVYGEATKTNWSKVQSSFQKQRINIKNAKGENWHTARVQGDRSISTIKGWLIPVDEVFDAETKPLINKHLTLLDI